MIYFRSLISTLILALGMPVAAFANGRAKVFTNPRCSENQTCDLQKVRFLSQDSQLSVKGAEYHGTKLVAEYQTLDLQSLKKYGFVQFIKGCHFSSRLENGKVKKELAYDRFFFGKFAVYHHPHWVIDSLDADPFYNSDREAVQAGFEIDILKERYRLYRWNTVNGSHERSSQRYYGREKPTRPLLYVTDHPGIATFYPNRGEAHNISLELRMCIYKTADIPTQTQPDDIHFAKPIDCFDWASSFIYDHRTGTFKTSSEIDPICL